MRSLYNNKLQQRLYTPLSYEESQPYIGHYYQRPSTAFNVSVVQIVSILPNGEVNYVEKQMKVININHEKQYSNGGTSFPTKCITVDHNAMVNPKMKKGRLVYDNINAILNNTLPTTIKLWVPKFPYELTTSHQEYTVMLDGWSPYTATNYGKYGTWNLEKINEMKTTI